MLIFTYPFLFIYGGIMKRENGFQADLIKDIKHQFQGAIVLKNDANYIQGFPDLTILYKDKWAVLECKKSSNEKHQPNQDEYVERLNGMGYSAFIFPENKKDILNELHKFFD